MVILSLTFKVQCKLAITSQGEIVLMLEFFYFLICSYTSNCKALKFILLYG